MTNDGVYLIAYNSLKRDEEEEIELRSIQTKNHTVDMHDDDMNKVILNTSTTAYPSSSTTTHDSIYRTVNPTHRWGCTPYMYSTRGQPDPPVGLYPIHACTQPEVSRTHR